MFIVERFYWLIKGHIRQTKKKTAIFVCLFFCCCKTNKLRAIWVGRLGTLAKKTLALKVEVEVVLLYVKPWLHPFDNWHWKVKKKKKRKTKGKEWKERNFASLKYKNYYLNRRALLTAADEFFSVCGPRQRGRATVW